MLYQPLAEMAYLAFVKHLVHSLPDIRNKSEICRIPKILLNREIREQWWFLRQKSYLLLRLDRVAKNTVPAYLHVS